MKVVCVHPDGKNVQPHSTFTVDNVVDTFTIQIRSLSGVDAETVKRIIQSKYEVISCEITERKIFSI
jgi:hypothetical protein